MGIKSNKCEIIELKKNIFQIKSRPPSCHVYLINGDNKIAMVDAGLSENFSNLESSLSKLGIRISDVNLIALTHEHLDHIGAAKHFVENSLILAHTQAAIKMALNDELAIMNKAFNRLNDTFHIDIFLENGVIIDLGNYKLRILHTPGHSSGSICIYEEISGIVFSGDTILANGVIAGICPSGSVSDYINSLNLLLSLKINAIYPGHGKISEKPFEDINKAIENAMRTLHNSRVLFNTLNSKKSFDTIFKIAKKLSLPK